jgi:hypothetical protein
MIKTALLVLAAAGLTGCAVYPATPYGAVYEPAPVYGPSPVYVTPAPVFIGGSVFYGHRRGYSRPPVHSHGHRPQLRPHAPPRPHLHRPGRHQR